MSVIKAIHDKGAAIAWSPLKALPNVFATATLAGGGGGFVSCAVAVRLRLRLLAGRRFAAAWRCVRDQRCSAAALVLRQRAPIRLFLSLCSSAN